MLAAPPSSPKRAVIEAQSRTIRRSHLLSCIDFGRQVSSTNVPDLLRHGFESLEQHFRNGSQEIMEHYHITRTCLRDCPGDALCVSLLMIVMILALCFIAPIIPFW